MHVNRTVSPRKELLQTLIRVAAVVVAFLLVIAVWAIVNYCDADAT